ncbi:ABC transporter substrate-binding protein [Niveispirillum fermenti]|uniref:ABC transporter substrate-binding protein n=1 Tax=Niveispirillum fermenti TaxID=1233113 RepID=UPI003A877678
MIVPAASAPVLSRRGLLSGLAGLGIAGTWLPGSSVLAQGDDWLHLRVRSDIGTLDPALHRGNMEEEIIRCLHVTLNRLTDFRQPLESSPAAAQRLEWLDPLRLLFTLRRGLVWTGDYGPVTASDVKFSMERIADPATASPWFSYFDMLEQVEVVDDRTGILHLKEPRPAFLLTSLPWYGGHIVCEKAVRALPPGTHAPLPPATCGPYMIDHWRPGQEMRLAANPAWTGPRPAFSRIRLSVILDDDVAILAYQARSLALTNISVNTLALLQKRNLPATTLIAEPGNNLMWLTLNMDNPALADIRIRRAIQHAINVDDIIQAVYAGIAQPATGIIPDGMTGHRDANLVAGNDPDAARRLLDAAGVETLDLTLSIVNNTTNMTIAQIIQAHLRDVGIHVRILPYDEGTYWTLGDQSLGAQWRDQQLVLMNFAGGVDPSDNTLWFLSAQVGALNWSRFADPEYDGLHQAALVETDPSRRDAMYRRMQDLMELSGGFCFLTHGIITIVHEDRLSPCILADGLLDLPRMARAGQAAVPATPPESTAP